jgi:hypothetical protein
MVSNSITTGQLHLVDVKIIFILSDTSSFPWARTSRIVTRGISLEIVMKFPITK